MTRWLAEDYRAELVRDARRGLDFSPAAGEPARWADRLAAGVSWLEHASAYAVMKWPNSANKAVTKSFSPAASVTDRSTTRAISASDKPGWAQASCAARILDREVDLPLLAACLAL